MNRQLDVKPSSQRLQRIVSLCKTDACALDILLLKVCGRLGHTDAAMENAAVWCSGQLLGADVWVLEHSHLALCLAEPSVLSSSLSASSSPGTHSLAHDCTGIQRNACYRG